MSKVSIGTHQLQAAIPAVHDEAAQAADTEWPQILAFYVLLRIWPNPMVMLNHAIAAGLELLNALDADSILAGHHRLDAVRAHLLELAGANETAVAHFRAVAVRTASLPYRNYLLIHAARLAAMKQ